EIAGAERDLERAEILLEVFSTLRAGNGKHVLALSEEPGKDELGRLDALVPGDLLDPMDEPDVVLEVLVLEARMLPAAVVFGEVALVLDAPTQKSAAERRVGDVGNSELATSGQGVLCRLAIQQ